MLFNSIDFAVFLPVVFILYWFIVNKNLKLQNFLLLVVSYIFYGWWDWRFLSLILFSTLVDYFVGLGLLNQQNQLKRKLLLLTSILVNLGFLGFFKYYNFFVDNFISAFSFFGYQFQAYSLYIILPVGISFYTFQTMSYSLDIYYRKLQPTKDFISFAAFVSFFPQLVAGPIERATNLLPQFYKKRIFDYEKAVDGMRQILWGLFKKIVIADNAAVLVNDIFANYHDMNGSTLFLGIILFAFQIYCDFSGYSDIAIGCARLFGFGLMRNFAFPYFSRDIAEFWRRWHISLSTWFRDYVYFPMGGNRGPLWFQIKNTMILFLVSGFWHGANWTFIAWGALNAIYFLPLQIAKIHKKNTEIVAKGKLFPNLKEFILIGITFFITLIAWVFFRASSVREAFDYIYIMFGNGLFTIPEILPKKLIILIGILVLAEWLQRSKQHALEFKDVKIPGIIRWGIYFVIVFVIFRFGGTQQDFIYFQF